MMVGVKSSTETQLNAVGDYIHSLAEAAPVLSMTALPDGEAEFQQNCAACHGPDATGLVGPNITSASLGDITAAIDRVPMMVVMKVLGARDIKAIADYLLEVRESKPPKNAD
jgi:mono/diheme cytochrome c family protein